MWLAGIPALSALKLASFSLALVVALAASVAAADTLTLSPTRDNTLFEDTNGALSSGAGEFLFVGEISQGLRRRALLRFDLHALPAGASITSATLRLVLSTSSAQPSTIGVHRLLQDWGEGSSDSGGSAQSGGGQGAPSQANDATWIHTFFPSQLWTSPGGDFSAAATATQSVSALGSYSWSSAALTADVRDWAQNPSGNHGLVLIGDETVAGDAKRFNSRENLATTTVPQLVIVFTSAAPAPFPFWASAATCALLLLCGWSTAKRALRLRSELQARI